MFVIPPHVDYYLHKTAINERQNRLGDGTFFF